MYFSQPPAQRIDKLSSTRDIVVVFGEPGVGKRVIAKEIQKRGAKRDTQVVIDGLSASDSEFLDLDPRPPGRLTIANVGSVSPHHLHVLDKFLKGNPRVKVVLTAENRNEVSLNRGAIQVLEVMPLRHRLDELGELVKSIVGRLVKQLGKSPLTIDESLLAVLSKSSWPGNIKELMDVVGRGVLISHGDHLELPEDFLNEHQHVENAIQHIGEGRTFVLDQTLYLIESLLFRRVLMTFQYNQSKAAQILGLSEANFRYRLKKFKLPSVRTR